MVLVKPDAIQMRVSTQKKPTAQTVARYAPLKPMLEPMVKAGRTLDEIAYVLRTTHIRTPYGNSEWQRNQVARALRVCGLRTKRMSSI